VCLIACSPVRHVRLGNPTWLAAKMMQLRLRRVTHMRSRDVILVAYRVVNILQTIIYTSQLANPAMTRPYRILHTGIAHCAAHQGGPLYRKQESAYLPQGLLVGPATPCCAYSLMHVKAKRLQVGKHAQSQRNGGGFSLDPGVQAVNHALSGLHARLWSVRTCLVASRHRELSRIAI
jgi:hypothetical protein